MRRFPKAALALRLLLREARAGELTVLALSLALAVAAISAVSMFASRFERALSEQAAQLLAADLSVSSGAPAPAAWQAEAGRLGLTLAHTTTFPSMAGTDAGVTLANIKAVDAAYPLRGELTIADAAGRERVLARGPAPGEAWVDARLAERLGLKAGDKVSVGRLRLTVGNLLIREPDAIADMYGFVPRLMMAEADLAAAGLIGPGSRVRYRLLVAGDSARVAEFGAWLKPRLPNGARLENVEEARPEVRVALERARRFLGMTALLTVALSVAAVVLAVRRYLARHWRTVALLRAQGQSSGAIGALFGWQLAWLGVAAGVVGVLAGFAVQSALAAAVAPLLSLPLPAPSAAGVLVGFAAALVLTLGVAWPPILALRQVPALAVLRAELPPPRAGVAWPALSLAALLLLAALQLGDALIALWLLPALAGFLALTTLMAWGLLKLMRAPRAGSRPGWRYGVASLARRPTLALAQIVALSVGLFALLLMTVVRADLVGAWQASVPANAPNKFVINLQTDQLAAFDAAFAKARLAPPPTYPMVRARLVAIGGVPLDPARYEDARARRLAEREFNLSWSTGLPQGNTVSAGRWWGTPATPQFSVEEDIAATLGIRMGDTLAFESGGERFEAKVTSLRKVAWDSFRANFFVLAPPAWLEHLPASRIASFYLPPARERFVGELVHALPNLTVIDVGNVIAEVRAIVERLAHAIELMFVLALAAGVLVMWAVFAATRQEREADMALMRALGASRAQLTAMLAGELAFVGALAGLIAGAGAWAAGAVVAVKVLALAHWPALWLVPGGVVAGLVLVFAAGWPLLRKVARVPPLAVLRNEQG